MVILSASTPGFTLDPAVALSTHSVERPASGSAQLLTAKADPDPLTRMIAAQIGKVLLSLPVTKAGDPAAPTAPQAAEPAGLQAIEAYLETAEPDPSVEDVEAAGLAYLSSTRVPSN